MAGSTPPPPRPPIWRLHTKLYKGPWNVSANNSKTVGHKDLRFGQIVYILVLFITFHFFGFSTGRFPIFFLCLVYCVTVKTKNTMCIPANFFWDISVRFLSWKCWDFWRRHDHFRRFPKPAWDRSFQPAGVRLTPKAWELACIHVPEQN